MGDNIETEYNAAIKSLQINRLSAKHEESVYDLVIEEKLFCIDVKGVAQFTTLCTPIDLEALAVGMLFERGIIANKNDIESLEVAEENIKIKINNHVLAIEKYRDFARNPGFGNNSKTNKDLFGNIAPTQGYLKQIEFSKIIDAMANLHKCQEIFPKTGAAHAALLFNGDGECLAFAEDIGRHNALDKVIGQCILAERSIAGCALALSSRISYEMVAKAARASIELIAAVSAPSSLAIAAAKYWRMTLCGFTRVAKTNIYCGEERIVL